MGLGGMLGNAPPHMTQSLCAKSAALIAKMVASVLQMASAAWKVNRGDRLEEEVLAQNDVITAICKLS